VLTSLLQTYMFFQRVREEPNMQLSLISGREKASQHMQTARTTHSAESTSYHREKATTPHRNRPGIVRCASLCGTRCHFTFQPCLLIKRAQNTPVKPVPGTGCWGAACALPAATLPARSHSTGTARAAALRQCRRNRGIRSCYLPANKQGNSI